MKPGGCFAPPPPLMSLGGQTIPCLRFLKYCKNLISALSMLIYFRLHFLLYIFNRGVDVLQASLLKKGLANTNRFVRLDNSRVRSFVIILRLRRRCPSGTSTSRFSKYSSRQNFIVWMEVNPSFRNARAYWRRLLSILVKNVSISIFTT